MREDGIPSGEVHVWAAHLDEHAGRVDDLRELLSVDECERAAGFRLQRDRLAFTLRRGILRTLLGRYLRMEPRDLRFAYGRYGKPALTTSALSFNVAEAGGVALYAITAERAVGVDVEPLHRPPDLEGLARTALSTSERVRLLRLPESDRAHAFLERWTRKEAYLKALGDGLVRPPEAVDLARLEGRWKIETMAPAAGYLGAIAAEGDRWGLRLLRW